MKHESSHMSKESILQTNKKIDKELLRKFEELESKLAKVGVDIKPSFRLTPPLGETYTHLFGDRC